MVDYRDSHLAKGAVYDGAIAGSRFDAYIDYHERRILLGIVERFFPTGVARYIDFACGTGRITAAVEPAAGRSFGIDVSESMLEAARRRCLRTTFVLADITKDPIPMPPADLVTAFRFFGNAQAELRALALQALVPLVRPDGYLVVNNHRNPLSIRGALGKLTTEWHCPSLTYGHLRSELQRSGFEIVETHPIGLLVVRGRPGRPERRFAFPGAAHVAPDSVIVARPARAGAVSTPRP